MTNTSFNVLKYIDALIESCEIEIRMYQENPVSLIFQKTGESLADMHKCALLELEHYKQLKECLLNENSTVK